MYYNRFNKLCRGNEHPTTVKLYEYKIFQAHFFKTVSNNL